MSLSAYVSSQLFDSLYTKYRELTSNAIATMHRKRMQSMANPKKYIFVQTFKPVSNSSKRQLLLNFTRIRWSSTQLQSRHHQRLTLTESQRL